MAAPATDMINWLYVLFFQCGSDFEYEGKAGYTSKSELRKTLENLEIFIIVYFIFSF